MSQRASTAAPLSAHSISVLSQARDTLHLLHHRNRNQHRRSAWWRQFSQYRRQVGAVVREAEALAAAAPRQHLARVRRARRDEHTARRIRARRVIFGEAGAVARWWRAFSQLVADARFAPLGLVLLALLAEVSAAVGLKGDAADGEAREADGAARQADGAAQGWDRAAPADPTTAETTHREEDLGEVIAREGRPEGTSPDRAHGEVRDRTGAGSPRPLHRGDPSSAEAAAVVERPRRRKRHKPGDAIDDLFSSLG